MEKIAAKIDIAPREVCCIRSSWMLRASLLGASVVFLEIALNRLAVK